jgi:4-hydroxy-tetrahydrodipicolinate reductase
LTAKVAVYGAGGRMGQTLVRLLAEAGDLTLVGAIDRPESAAIGRDAGELAGAGNLGVAVDADLASGLLGADVVIDFSLPDAFDRMIRAAVKAKVAVVSGTTRLSPASEVLLAEAARTIPVLWAPNMSVGVQLLARIVEEAVKALGASYDVEIVETHHNEKIDAPSGTATFLREAAQRARDLSPVYGREGLVGARKSNEIGVHAVRGGGVVGDHTVHLIGPFDRLEITHRAMSRELFAAGALSAARWIAGRPAGRYTLADVIS